MKDVGVGTAPGTHVRVCDACARPTAASGEAARAEAARAEAARQRHLSANISSWLDKQQVQQVQQQKLLLR